MLCAVWAWSPLANVKGSLPFDRSLWHGPSLRRTEGGRRERCERLKGARNAASGKRRRIPPGHASAPRRKPRRVRPRPPLAPCARTSPATRTAQAFRAPLRRKKRASPHRHAHHPGATLSAPSLRRFGGLAVPVAQSSRWALAAPSARFAPHLRVALGLRPKCPLGTRFPPVPSELHSESPVPSPNLRFGEGIPRERGTGCPLPAGGLPR